METVNWGILSTAKIGTQKVIPSIQQADSCTVTAIASRSPQKAQYTAEKLDISRYYSSYENLLKDQEIDAIYNPLPNHLHVPYTIKAVEAGKHVLCEKPIALDEEEARELLKTSQKYADIKVMEAFMYRFHPQWVRAKSMVKNGRIGRLQTVESMFSYYNKDPNDIRNNAEMGGGGLMDIGCYCISLSRFLFNKEPENILGEWKIDPQFKIDYLASGILNFGSGLSTFTCATQTAPQQEVNIIGTEGRIVIDIPFNAPLNKETSIWKFKNNSKEEIVIEPANQYMIQAEKFAESILKGFPPPTPLEDAIQNMITIDAFRKSAKQS